ncbi:MAG: GntR family transcriptional regulator [Nocardioidaceae bacterium]|nr:GntR family transcriptional regulator [Nocardioidaceae bacterium]
MSHEPSLDERLHEVWLDAARRGATMPSEPALAASLSSSRPAVREALVRLEERGYIHRRKGAGTVVNASLLGIAARFDRQIDKSALIAAMGRTPRLDVLGVERTTLTLDEAQQYELAPGTAVLRVHKRWSADGHPVMLARDTIPYGPGYGDVEADPERPMVEIAVALSGERVEWEIVWPGPGDLSVQDAALVGREPGESVLALDVTGVSRGGRVCYWTSEVHLRGAFRYAMVRRAEW